MIRRATSDDLERIFRIATKAYLEFDRLSSLQWAAGALQNPDIIALVGDHSFGVSGVSRPFYAPQIVRGTMLFIASDHPSHETCVLLQRMIKWAKEEKGAQTYHFGSETPFDLSALAKRVGATKDKDSYAIRF